MSISAHTRHRASFLQLLSVARGGQNQNHHATNHTIRVTTDGNDNTGRPILADKVTSSSTNINPLPCFPLHPEHIRIISPSTCNSPPRVSSSPAEFHSHLCQSIVNAKRRVKIATLYIGAANGCMSSSSIGINTSNTIGSNNNHHHPPKEKELLESLQRLSREQTKNNNNNNNHGVEIKIVMDASRALRPIQIVPISSTTSDNKRIRTADTCTTTSADEVYYSLFPKENHDGAGGAAANGGRENNMRNTNVTKGVSLFNVHTGLRASLPSPLNEVLGVFHLKVYIIDDELILSGANLSEEYFTDRLDRYISFIKGANGLVDFYSNLIDILYNNSTEYCPTPSSSQANGSNTSGTNATTFALKNMDEISLTNELNKLFDGSNCNHSFDDTAFAYAIPTFQPSQRFVQNDDDRLSFTRDSDITKNLLLHVKDSYPRSSVYVSSAYLNPTKTFLSAIETFGSTSSSNDGTYNGASYLLSASPVSHGFKPKKKNDAVNGSGKGWVPSVFLKIAEELNAMISPNGGKVLLYDRDGYTFHAKGLWLTSGSSINGELDGDRSKNGHNILLERCKIANPENDLIASIIGSSNFGARSEMLDWESNCILVMNPLVVNDEKSTNAKAAIAGDWNSMLEHCVELGSRDDLKATSDMSINWFMSRLASQLARKFF